MIVIVPFALRGALLAHGDAGSHNRRQAVARARLPQCNGRGGGADIGAVQALAHAFAHVHRFSQASICARHAHLRAQCSVANHCHPVFRDIVGSLRM